jgi:hypothetical protein
VDAEGAAMLLVSMGKLERHAAAAHLRDSIREGLVGGHVAKGDVDGFAHGLLRTQFACRDQNGVQRPSTHARRFSSP